MVQELIEETRVENKRVVVAWRADEDAFLIANAGKNPYREVAGELGRTYDAVRHRALSLGLVVLDESWVTAKEASRVTGLSNTTIVRRIEGNHLPGARVGQFWNVDLKTVDLAAVSQEPAASCCVNCGGPLSGINKNHCSKRCNAEYVPGMVFPSYLRLGFQHWLRSSKLAELRNFALFGNNLRTKRDQSFSEQEGLINSILANEFPGLVVPWEYIAYRIGVDYKDSNNQAEVQILMEVLKDKLHDRRDIFEVDSMGWGVGVSLFTEDPIKLIMLRVLWQKESTYVSRGFLLRSLIGELKDRYLPLVSYTVESLQTDLEDSPYRILSEKNIAGSFNYQCYKLIST